MGENNDKSPNDKLKSVDVIKMILITIAAMILLTALITALVKSGKDDLEINLLSDEEAEGITYTEKAKIDDSDMWETEISINSETTYIVSSSEETTEAELIVEFPIDINLANAEELMLIDGVGTATAEKIISYRNMYGYFCNYNQLLNIDGIGEKKLENLMEYIYISEEWFEVAEETVAEISETVTVTSVPVKITETTVTVTKSTTVTTEDIIIVNEEFVIDVDEDLKNDTESEAITYENTTYEETTRYVQFPLELNTASVEDLMCINGIGEYTAQKIVEYARQYGFYSVDDLLNVDGIGNSKLANIKPYVYVNSYMLPPQTETTTYSENITEAYTEAVIQRVNVNSCSKYDLMQLPGIDEAMADKIIEFRDTIGGFLKIEELTLVEGMTNDKMSAIWDYVYI